MFPHSPSFLSVPIFFLHLQILFMYSWILKKKKKITSWLLDLDGQLPIKFSKWIYNSISKSSCSQLCSLSVSSNGLHFSFLLIHLWLLIAKFLNLGFQFLSHYHSPLRYLISQADFTSSVLLFCYLFSRLFSYSHNWCPVLLPFIF